MRVYGYIAALAALGLAGCATIGSYQSASQGYWYGCETGYADADWPGKSRIPIPVTASRQFRDAWNRGYNQCLADGLRNPRYIPGGPGL